MALIFFCKICFGRVWFALGLKREAGFIYHTYSWRARKIESMKCKYMHVVQTKERSLVQTSFDSEGQWLGLQTQCVVSVDTWWFPNYPCHFKAIRGWSSMTAVIIITTLNCYDHLIMLMQTVKFFWSHGYKLYENGHSRSRDTLGFCCDERSLCFWPWTKPRLANF